MTNATTFVLADADLSVPAGAIDIDRTTAEARFFGLLREAKPDVILLDLTDGNGAGPEAIRTIRLKCRVPILVVCDINDRRLFEYRVAGATECIPSPLDLVRLNQTLTQIRITGDRARILPRLETLYFSGSSFTRPRIG
jgi:DNA-binding NarL/FixJ family response regulator